MHALQVTHDGGMQQLDSLQPTCPTLLLVVRLLLVGCS
jgi:hypothetical protein